MIIFAFSSYFVYTPEVGWMPTIPMVAEGVILAMTADPNTYEGWKVLKFDRPINGNMSLCHLM